MPVFSFPRAVTRSKRITVKAAAGGKPRMADWPIAMQTDQVLAKRGNECKFMQKVIKSGVVLSCYFFSLFLLLNERDLCTQMDVAGLLLDAFMILTWPIKRKFNEVAT